MNKFINLTRHYDGADKIAVCEEVLKFDEFIFITEF